MQQLSFREFRIENESKRIKANKQTTCLINKQGLRCYEKETIHHRGWQSGDRDPVSRTSFNKIHSSRFGSVIVGETSGKRNFHDQNTNNSRITHTS